MQVRAIFGSYVDSILINTFTNQKDFAINQKDFVINQNDFVNQKGLPHYLDNII